MSEVAGGRLAWLFVTLVLACAVVLFQGGWSAAASEDHDEARALRYAGDIVPLAELMKRPRLAGRRVLEVELEREDGGLVYELELLDETGRVQKLYFDAVTGQLLKTERED